MNDVNETVPSYVPPIEVSGHLWDTVNSIDASSLTNGRTALYWHLASVVGLHMKKDSEEGTPI